MPDSSLADASPDRALRCVHYVDAMDEEAGGVVRAVIDLLEGLCQAGVDVTLLTGNAKDVPADWSAENPDTPTVVTIHRAMTPWLGLGQSDRRVIDEQLAAADVLHLHTPWDPYNVAVAAEARRRGVPYVVSAHGMLDDWSMSQSWLKKRVYLALVGRRLLRGSYALHCTAQGEERQALRYAPGAGGRVLPLLLDLAPYADPPGPEAARQAFPALEAEGPKLLFLSRLHPKKGVERLIRATAVLRSAGTPAEAFLAGPGENAYLAELKRLAAELGVEQQTHFLGMVRGDVKLSLYQACDVFVLPTSQENFGIVLAEAMASGLPTVTTHGVDIAPELEQHGAAIVSDRPAEGEQELVQAIQGLLDNAPSSPSMRRGVLDWLDPERVTAGYVRLYQDARSSR